MIQHVRGRRSLLWLLVPFVLFVFALPLANRIDPVILGLPFLAFWVLMSVILSPLAIWLASRGDPYCSRPTSRRAPMSTDAKVAIAIFAVAMVGTLALGIAAMRGRDANLGEWCVGGRSFGVLLTWVLLAGECYTSFSYLGAAGWAYGYGAPIFYLVGYMATGYATVYLFAPMVWGYAKRHDLISITDVIAHRFGSKRFGAFVAIVATLALLPYIQLQIQGMGLVVSRCHTARSGSRPRS